MQHYDAVIVGGGVAGGFAALRLAHAGWRIALIEKAARHRHKACGHCLHQRSFASLERAGVLEDVKSAASGRTNSLRVHQVGKRVLQSNFASDDDAAQGLMISRSVLDQLLIDRAAALGAEIFQPARARVIFNASNTRVVVECGSLVTTIQTPLVIGADGVGSSVARIAGLADAASAGRNFGCSFSCNAPKGQDGDSGTIEMFMTDGGYLGMVNDGRGHLHIAMRIAASLRSSQRVPVQFVRAAAHQHERLQSIGLHRLARDDMRHFCAVGPLPWQPRNVASNRAALVGDAAGYIEPFTGEGMTWALQSADALATVLEQTPPGTWNEKLATAYARQWKRQVSRRQRLCRTVATALKSPRLTGMCISAARRMPALTNHVVRMVVAS